MVDVSRLLNKFCQAIKWLPEHVLFVAYFVEILVSEDYLYEQPKGKLLIFDVVDVSLLVKAKFDEGLARNLIVTQTNRDVMDTDEIVT